MKKPVTGRKIAKGLKSFGQGLGEFLEASAVIAEERRRVEAEARQKVTDAIREYEDVTGKRFHLAVETPSISYLPPDVNVAHPIVGMQLPWDPERKGHLINCRRGCWDTHCLACGTRTIGYSTYCPTHEL